MVRETGVQSQVESYQRLKKWYLMLPWLALSIIRYGSRVNWSNPGKGVAPSLTPQCSSYWKGSLWFTFDYGRRLYHQHIYIYICNNALSNVLFLIDYCCSSFYEELIYLILLYIYIYVCVYMHTNTYAYIHVCVHLYGCIDTYMYKHRCTSTCIYTVYHKSEYTPHISADI